MDNFNWLLQGFAEAATPMNLLYAVIGVLLGTAVGVLPGIGPAMTVALLLPITYNVSPSAAFIMFAGIFYGGMYGGSTTSILLNTPGESSSVITAIEGNKMAKAGRAAQALATAAIGSFVAGTIGTAAAGGLRAADLEIRHVRWARRRTSRSCCSHWSLSPRCWAPPSFAAAISLFLGLAIGARRHRLPHGSATATFGMPQLGRRNRHRGHRGCDLRSRRGAVGGRAPATPASRRHPCRPAVDGPRRLAPVLETVAARHRVRLPVRRPARRRSRDADVLVLHHREAAVQAQGRVRQGRHRGRRRAGGGQQRHRPQALWCRCCRSVCRPTPPRR